VHTALLPTKHHYALAAGGGEAKNRNPGMSARFQYKFKCEKFSHKRLATLNIKFQHTAKYRYIYFSKSRNLMPNEFIRIIDGADNSTIDYKFRDDVYMPWIKIK